MLIQEFIGDIKLINPKRFNLLDFINQHYTTNVRIRTLYNQLVNERFTNRHKANFCRIVAPCMSISWYQGIFKAADR